MSILIARDDGVIPLDNAQPVPRTLVDIVEQLLDTLAVPKREDRQQNEPAHPTCGPQGDRP